MRTSRLLRNLSKLQGDDYMEKSAFERELTDLLNKHSMENASDTPDYILAGFLKKCLAAYNFAVKERESWYGRTEDYEDRKITKYTPSIAEGQE